MSDPLKPDTATTSLAAPPADVASLLRELGGALTVLEPLERGDLSAAVRSLLFVLVAGTATPAELTEELRRIGTLLEFRRLTRNKTERRQTAVHEAAHAVSGMILGLEVLSVSALPDAGFSAPSLGACHFRSPVPRSTRAQIEALVVVELAGPQGERMAGFDPRDEAQHFTAARQELLALELTDLETITLLDHLRARAAALLRGSWRWVEATATALLERETLSQSEIAALKPEPLPEE